MHEQVLANAIIAACGYFIFGVAFAGVYRIGRFFDVSPAVGYVVGAYLGHWLANDQHVSAPIAICVSVLIASGLGALVSVGQDSRWYCCRSAGEKFVVSLALVIVSQGVVALWLGDDTKVFPWPSEVLDLGGVSVTGIQLWLCALSAAAWIGIGMLFYLTPWGRLYRAVANDPELATIYGVRTKAIAVVTGAVCMSLAAVTGILIGADVGVTPTMGFRGILFGVIAVVIGGAESFAGIALGALILATTQHMVSWYLGGRWQDVAVFMILAAFLLLRPQGVLGGSLRKATV